MSRDLFIGMKMIELKCSFCHKPIAVKAKHINYKRKIGQTDFYCSKKCSYDSFKCGTIIKTCLYCHNSFETTDGCESPKCCSKKCAGKYSQSFIDPHDISEGLKRAWGRGDFKTVAEKIRKYKTCPTCKNRFYGAKTYCSLLCLKNSDVKVRISTTRKEMFQSGKLRVTGGTTKWIPYNNIKVQGSYEYRTCVILDKWVKFNKISKWEYTKDRFSYIGLDGKTHNYLLDLSSVSILTSSTSAFFKIIS